MLFRNVTETDVKDDPGFVRVVIQKWFMGFSLPDQIFYQNLETHETYDAERYFNRVVVPRLHGKLLAAETEIVRLNKVETEEAEPTFKSLRAKDKRFNALDVISMSSTTPLRRQIGKICEDGAWTTYHGMKVSPEMHFVEDTEGTRYQRFLSVHRGAETLHFMAQGWLVSIDGTLSRKHQIQISRTSLGRRGTVSTSHAQAQEVVTGCPEGVETPPKK